MAAPRKHPVDEFIRIAEESAKLLWKCYDAHLSFASYDPAWKGKASAIFARCESCDERLQRLKRLRARTLGPKRTTAALEVFGPSEKQELLAEAEWQVKKFQLMLSGHQDALPRDERWHERQNRLIDGLKNALAAFADLAER